MIKVILPRQYLTGVSSLLASDITECKRGNDHQAIRGHVFYIEAKIYEK